MAKQRPAIPIVVQTELLLQSRRRCCLCFGLKADIEVKEGQIAHLDRNPSNNKLDNLAWLCLSHHDHYDSVRRQTKRLTPEEVKSYRAQLHSQLSALMSKSAGETNGQSDETETDSALEVLHRYSYADKAATKVIKAEILTRIEQIYQFSRLYESVVDAAGRENLTDEQAELRYERLDKEIRETLKIPDGIWGLHSDGPLPSSWRKSSERLARKWIAGLLSYDECIDVIWVFDEEYDLDYHYIFFGLPNRSLSAMQMRGMHAFIYEHGQREFIRRRLSESDGVPF